jgi:hypothetical protein
MQATGPGKPKHRTVPISGIFALETEPFSAVKKYEKPLRSELLHWALLPYMYM